MGTYVESRRYRAGPAGAAQAADWPRLTGPRCRPALAKPARVTLAELGLGFDMGGHGQQRLLCLAHALRLAVLVHGCAHGRQVEVVDDDVATQREAPNACRKQGW